MWSSCCMAVQLLPCLLGSTSAVSWLNCSAETFSASGSLRSSGASWPFWDKQKVVGNDLFSAVPWFLCYTILCSSAGTRLEVGEEEEVNLGADSFGGCKLLSLWWGPSLTGEVVLFLAGGCMVFSGPQRKEQAEHGVGTHLLLSLLQMFSKGQLWSLGMKRHNPFTRNQMNATEPVRLGEGFPDVLSRHSISAPSRPILCTSSGAPGTADCWVGWRIWLALVFSSSLCWVWNVGLQFRLVLWYFQLAGICMRSPVVPSGVFLLSFSKSFCSWSHVIVSLQIPK